MVIALEIIRSPWLELLHPFEHIKAKSIEEAVKLSAGDVGQNKLIAGGTDFLTEIKEGVAHPQRVVDLGGIPELQGIRENEEALAIGAMATIADIAHHPGIRRRYAALAEAAEGLATPQIRNLGTLGGNLNQRPRCWYYRHSLTVCLKKGGDHCHALAGTSDHLCVTGGERCYITHPSDTAVALVALDALIEIAGPSGTRILPIEQYFTGPQIDVTRENILSPGELVTRVYLQGPVDPGPIAEESKSIYLKATQRQGGDFAVASVAASLNLEGKTVRQMSVVLGGVAPVPFRARRVEEYLRGRRVAEVDPVHAANLTLQGATPLSSNGYKVIVATNLVKQAINRLLKNRGSEGQSP